MTLFQAVLLGALQGITEFLPISSSGHLVLVEHLFRLDVSTKDMLGFDILVHAGTALALIICYRKQWLHMVQLKDEEHRTLLKFIVYATIPAAVVGALLSGVLASSFRSLFSVSASFLVTAGVLLLAMSVEKRRGTVGETHSETMTLRQALIVGLAQVVAIIPGISRSGVTIATGQLSNISREHATDFSFLLAFPIIIGAAVFTLVQALIGDIDLPSLTISIAAFCSAYVMGSVAIYGLKAYVRRYSIGYFALYLIPLGIGVFFWELISTAMRL
jgi:undecaprenyl-diphosphatase